jgi:elongation factor G
MSERMFLVEIAVEPRIRGDQEKLGRALAQLAAEDPSFGVAVDHESRQTIIKGTSEGHLEAMVDRIRRGFEIDVVVGAPQVAYRETITRLIQVEHTHKQQRRGSGDYARVKLRLEPKPPGTGVAFTNKAPSATVPAEFVPSVEKAVRDALGNGVLAGFPVIDLTVELTDGAYHEADSSPLAFMMATRAAMKEGLTKAEPKLLEPVMLVEVTTPLDHMGDVIGDLNTRRAWIIGNEQRDAGLVIIARVPLANLFGYEASLATWQASATMTFRHYDRVPPSPSGDDDPGFRPAMGMRA